MTLKIVSGNAAYDQKGGRRLGVLVPNLGKPNHRWVAGEAKRGKSRPVGKVGAEKPVSKDLGAEGIDPLTGTEIADHLINRFYRPRHGKSLNQLRGKRADGECSQEKAPSPGRGTVTKMQRAGTLIPSTVLGAARR